MWFNQLQKPVILASASPRRKELLASVGLRFDVIPASINEKELAAQLLANPTFDPKAYVLALSEAKGQSVYQDYPEALVISADTVVVMENTILEKPENSEDAKNMLSKIQGRQHTVWSAISIFQPGKQQQSVATQTRVTMRPLTNAQIDAYIATGEPMDKAGSYAIQGLGAVLVEQINGCYSNVVGLSLPTLYRMLIETKG